MASNSAFFQVRDHSRDRKLTVDEALERAQASAERADGWMRVMNDPSPPPSRPKDVDSVLNGFDRAVRRK